jgi:MFS family permease
MSSDPSATPSPAPRTGWASLKDMTGYQWFVFIVCCLAWDMDWLDQQLFVLARRPAMESLVPKVTKDDVRFEQQKKDMLAKADGKAVSDERVLKSLQDADIGKAAGWSTSMFLIGWSVGGIGFGVLGDRWGRVKTLMLTIGLYAVFTGLSALSTSTWDFHAYRLLTGLGVGGVFAASVTRPAVRARVVPGVVRVRELHRGTLVHVLRVASRGRSVRESVAPGVPDGAVAADVRRGHRPGIADRGDSVPAAGA